ncbi:unnamed protein product [Schistosoma margrebowiei]|uniref:Uncharacterized protein n=1 Tax=Schistosoma margrebowiei TaxID=48269 RepID=A0A183MMF2_9TREM|nr:unnamed protein product [Schistosoma margrebowiei]
MQLDDLDFSDDLALLSQTQQQMQEKTNSVAAASGFSIQMSRQFYCMGQKPGEQRKPSSRRYRMQLDDLDFSDDLALLSQTQQQMQEKTNSVAAASGFSIQMSRQFYCMGQKPGEQRKPSSRRYRCLLTVVYAKYFRSVGRTLVATTYCGREQTRSQ